MPRMEPRQVSIKWVGDPSVLLEDEYTVADWDWENNRVVAVKGVSTRTCDPGAFPGLSRTYVFGGRTVDKFIIEMDEIDADIILRNGVWEFVDVTDEEHPELVVNEPIFIRNEREARSLFQR